LCAAASIPRASPETTIKPTSPSSRAIICVNLSPAPDALREPTIATIGRASAVASPRMVRSGGASSIICSRAG
jgi:hypothetical protein